ncbi:MAG: VWA domain-containing protein [Candidatus Nanopelagicales bacterium]
MSRTAPFYVPLIFRLRRMGVPVGTQEALALGDALAADLHGESLDGFYFLARSLLIHNEGHLDAFDRAFLAEFKGVTDDSALLELTDELREWLDEAREELEALGIDEAELLDSLDIDELRDLFEQRKREQTERHDGGNTWIGTQGTSPFGEGGLAGGGISTGSSGGGRMAFRTADARQYQGYRSDVTLDIRQMEIALRRLRAFVRDGAEVELDMERTIDATARNAGEIEVVTRPPTRPDTHVMLLIDVGGSMFPYASLMSQLFSATKKATHFKDLQVFYFHNLPYGKVFETDRFTDPVWLRDLLRRYGSNYKLIMVGDAYMAPYELGQRGQLSPTDRTGISGFEWLHMLKQHYPGAVWLNPEPASRWPGSTIEAIGTVFDMFPLTVDGLTEAMNHLRRTSR